MRVLLADDSSLILERLQDMVSMHKQVEIAGLCKNGPDTLNAIRTLKPDLAIVDIQMPGLSGIEVLKEIRKEDKAVTFIILTFNSASYYRQLAIQSGADHFFSKADDFENLAMVVAEMAEHEGGVLKP